MPPVFNENYTADVVIFVHAAETDAGVQRRQLVVDGHRISLALKHVAYKVLAIPEIPELLQVGSDESQGLPDQLLEGRSVLIHCESDGVPLFSASPRDKSGILQVFPGLVEGLRRVAPLDVLVDEHSASEAVEHAHLDGLQYAEVLGAEVEWRRELDGVDGLLVQLGGVTVPFLLVVFQGGDYVDGGLMLKGLLPVAELGGTEDLCLEVVECPEDPEARSGVDYLVLVDSFLGPSLDFLVAVKQETGEVH